MDLLGCSVDLHYKNFAKWYLKTQTHFYLPRLRDNNRFTAKREVRIPPLSQTIDLQSIDTLLSEFTVHFCLRSPWLQIPPTLCRPFKLVWLSKSQHTPQWNVSEKSLHRSFNCSNQNNGSMKLDPYALETLSQMNQLTEELNGNPNKNQVAH